MFNTSALKKKIQISAINESDMIKPRDFISTGVYSVNKIISGSMFKGVPTNRITTFYGESGCVSGETNIYVLVKADVDILEYLEYFDLPNQNKFGKFFSAVPVSEKIYMLNDIGYSFADIARKSKLSRPTIYNMSKNDGMISSNSTSRSTSIGKLTDFLRRNVYVTKIKFIPELFKHSKDFMVFTPVGFRTCSNLIQKGEKETIIFCADGLGPTSVSVDHVLQLSDGKFDFADNVLASFENGNMVYVRTSMGNRLITSMRRSQKIPMYDIEINDDCHTYYADDYVAHNSGKSLIASQLIENALKEKNFDMVFYIDSEGGILYDKFEKSGIDMSKFQYVAVSTIEECTTTLRAIYNEVETQIAACKNAEDKPKCMVVLDSLSGLVTNKVIDDSTNGKVVQDMGLGAKLKNTMIKSFMTTVMKTDCPLIVIAHSYVNTNAMGPQKFQEMAGGNGIRYASHIVVQSSKSRKRQEDASKGLKAGDSYFSGNEIRYITYKDRLVKEGLETKMFVDLNKGISKFAGLWEDAIRLGYIIQSGAWYTVPSYDKDKKFRRDDIIDNEDMWNSFLKKMDEDFVRETAYGSGDAPVVNLAEEAL